MAATLRCNACCRSGPSAATWAATVFRDKTQKKSRAMPGFVLLKSRSLRGPVAQLVRAGDS